MDKRIVYLLMALAIAIPMFMPLGLPVRIPKSAQDFYDEIEKLNERDIVWIAAEINPANQAEFEPAIKAIFRHCLSKNLRIAVAAFYPQGANLAATWSADLVAEFGAVYGVDYINLGPRPSTSQDSIMDNARRDIIDAYSDRDNYGNPLSSYQIMADLQKASDVSLAVIFTQGSPGCAEYIANWQSTGDLMHMITVAAAVQIPVENPRYQAGMLQGMLGGMTGGAAYEKLIGHLGSATKGLDSQGLGHLLIVVLLIVGNACYFILKNLDEKAKTEAGGRS